MKVDNTQAPMPLTGAYGAHSVTPEAFIMMLESRLDDLDSQIELTMSRMQDRAAKAEELSKKLQGLHAMKTAAGTNSKVNILKEKVDYGAKPRSATSVAKELGVFGKLEIKNADKVGKAYYSTKQIDSVIRGYEEELRGVNSKNELDMVGLQSTMQQRQQAVSLGTNLLKTLNEASESVIRNIV